MKKLITCGITAAFCAAMLSTQAFAADITEDRSMYAGNAQQIAEEFAYDQIDVGLTLDTNTVAPYYYASIFDFIETGKLEFTLKTTPDEQRYFAELLDENGKYAGIVEFNCPFTKYCAMAYELVNYKESVKALAEPDVFHVTVKSVKEILEKHGYSTDVKEVKLARIDGLGDVYYINNGTEELLVPAKKSKDSVETAYFNNEVVVVNDELKAKVIEKIKNNNPMTGSGASTDNPGETNPNTGGASSAFVGVIALAGGIGLLKKKKN